VPGVFHQSSARLQQPLLEARQGPVPDSPAAKSAVATGSPGCTQSRSATAEPRSTESDGSMFLVAIKYNL
jgi:hypothetical protein